MTISLVGVVVPFTFISYLDCSYYTTEERETFGKENYLSLRWQCAKTGKHIYLESLAKRGNDVWHACKRGFDI